MTDSRRTLEQRKEAEDAVNLAFGCLKEDPPSLAILYRQLRIRGWTDERAVNELRKVGWV